MSMGNWSEHRGYRLHPDGLLIDPPPPSRA
jgi:hypothetical protein